MSVPGGIGLRDLGNETTFLNTIGYRWTLLNAKYYGVDYPVYQPDIFVMEETLWAMLTFYPNIDVILNSTLVQSGAAIKKTNTTITSIAVTTPKSTIFFSAKVFIDATYEGDIARFAGASYTYGREPAAQYNESLGGVLPYTTQANFVENTPVSATTTPDSSDYVPYIDPNPVGPVGSGDERMMGYSFRLCITPTKSKQAPFFPPPNYNASDFVLLSRYVQSLVASGEKPNGPALGDMVDVFPYRNYPPADKFDLCDSYAAFTSDAINLNIGYVEGSLAERAQIYTDTYYYVLGLVWFLATDPSVPEFTRNDTLKYGFCNDQWDSTAHIPPQLYVREGLRIIGDYVLTQNDVVAGLYRPDSIAIGSWAFDLHVVSRTAVKDNSGNLVANNEGNRFIGVNGHGDAYEIPIGTLLPKRAEITNLIVPVCHSASHVAYGSTRVEPTFVQLGESSGLIAALAVEVNSFVQDVNATSVQEILASRGVKVHVQE
eukprot:Phypoly_transcript_05513.p1 GENE.Phypoly_transcript_05513~~Phypoly_transcript_05513.p1  ORF type:complete len:488 (+),score=93.26 Phypoly_transcript_05513:480-1943(+)